MSGLSFNAPLSVIVKSKQRDGCVFTLLFGYYGLIGNLPKDRYIDIQPLSSHSPQVSYLLFSSLLSTVSAPDVSSRRRSHISNRLTLPVQHLILYRTAVKASSGNIASYTNIRTSFPAIVVKARASIGSTVTLRIYLRISNPVKPNPPLPVTATKKPISSSNCDDYQLANYLTPLARRQPPANSHIQSHLRTRTSTATCDVYQLAKYLTPHAYRQTPRDHSRCLLQSPHLLQRTQLTATTSPPALRLISRPSLRPPSCIPQPRSLPRSQVRGRPPALKFASSGHQSTHPPFRRASKSALQNHKNATQNRPPITRWSLAHHHHSNSS
jgi:hypothetical protein